MLLRRSSEGGLRRVGDQLVLPVHLLDNSVKQILIKEWSTAADVVDILYVST